MKISEKQLLTVLVILRDSVNIRDHENLFVFPMEVRARLFNDIIKQQEDELINIGDGKIKSE